MIVSFTRWFKLFAVTQEQKPFRKRVFFQVKPILNTDPDVVYERTNRGDHLLLHFADAASFYLPELFKLFIKIDSDLDDILVQLVSREHQQTKRR